MQLMKQSININKTKESKDRHLMHLDNITIVVFLQKSARIAAEKHYSDRLRALGICPEFVSKKGQTTKLLQCSSAEDFNNSTDARER